MNFQSRQKFESKVPGFEGVAFTLNRMTEGRRIKLRLALADATARLRETLVEIRRLKEQETPEPKRAAELLDTVTAIVEDEVTPAWVRWGLHAIEGLEIDGQPATVESLIESGPTALYAEIAAAVRREAGLSDEQQGESEPLSTSGAPVDGGMSDTTAANADDGATSKSETAESSSASK
jgi:hypothetical protein